MRQLNIFIVAALSMAPAGTTFGGFLVEMEQPGLGAMPTQLIPPSSFTDDGTGNFEVSVQAQVSLGELIVTVLAVDGNGQPIPNFRLQQTTMIEPLPPEGVPVPMPLSMRFVV